MIQQSSGTGHSLAQENQNLKAIIQTMKNEMDTIVERIKSEYVVHSPKSED
jgi:cell division protein FtsB